MSFPPLQKTDAPPAQSGPQAVLWLVDAWRDLGRIMARWRELLEFGPVRGAYYPLVFTVHDPAGLGAVAVAHLIPSVSQMRIVEAALWCDQGELTAEIHCGAGEVLGATTVSSTPVRVSASADFSLQDVPAVDSLWVEIVSIDSGAPEMLVVKVTAKSLSKVEPA